MNKIIFSSLLAATLAWTGCDRDAATLADQQGVMRFAAELPGTTRATATGFETGDRIGLFVVKYAGSQAQPLQLSGNHVNNLSASYDGSVWQTVKPVYWPEEAVDVYAYYPYRSLISVDEQPFSVRLDQRTPRVGEEPGGYEASDLLWTRTAHAQAADGPVSLRFRHLLSKISIRLQRGPDYDGALPENATVYLHNTVPEAVVDLATGAVCKDGYGTPKTITCRKVSDELYEAIVVPQRLDTRRPLIELVAGKVAYLVEDQFNFRAGTHAVVTLTLNSDPGKIDINIGGGIGGGWN